MACTMASILPASRPSEKLGTHSTSWRGIYTPNVTVPSEKKECPHEWGRPRGHPAWKATLQPGPLDAVRLGEADGLGIAGIGVANYAQAGVAGEDPFQAAIHLCRAVGHHDHAGMLRVADADAAAIVDAYPGGAGGGVHQGVEQRPIGDGVRAVAHAFGLAKRRGDGAGVQVVAADHDGGLQFSIAHQPVDGEAEFGALAVAQPADARRQALKLNALARQREPSRQSLIMGE